MIEEHRFRVEVMSVAAAEILASNLVVTPAAEATSTQARNEPHRETPARISERQWSDAISEARRLGYVSRESTDARGVTTTTIALGDGISFDMAEDDSPTTRLSAGSDGYGKYVAFNATDQGAIISGAAWGLGVGLCAISLGAFCVVSGAILLAATVAETSNGIRCGQKALRVYPFSGHKPPCAGRS